MLTPPGGRGRGKMGTGICLFFTGKLGLDFLGLGCLKVGMGNKILK